METIQAITVVRNLKEFYDNYSKAFDVVISQLEGTLQVQLTELEEKKVEVETTKLEKTALASENNTLKQRNAYLEQFAPPVEPDQP